MALVLIVRLYGFFIVLDKHLAYIEKPQNTINHLLTDIIEHDRNYREEQLIFQHGGSMG